MEIEPARQEQLVVSSAREECFQFQLDALKEEISYIEGIIDRMDSITQATKNWGIVTWTASVGVLLGKPELRAYVAVTAILPLVFWLIDAGWRRLQKRSVYRARQISKFVNDGRLLKAFEERQFGDFEVLDPIGVTHRKDSEYKSYISLRRTLFFREVWLIYWALAGLSLILGFLTYFFPEQAGVK